METTIEFNGYKWSRKPNGYYQSTVRCTDGSRKNWLHQYVYELTNGEIPEGYEVHHIDENKTNNSSTNLTLLTAEEHRAEHLEQDKTSGAALAAYVAENFDEVQELAKKGKQGLYIGKKKRRKLSRVPVRCACCDREFTPSEKSRKDARFCSNSCRNTWHNEHAKERECKECGTVFKPTSRGAFCCSTECRGKQNKEAVRRDITHVCIICGDTFTGTQTQTCCGDKCARDRKNALKREYRKHKKDMGI